MQVCGPFRFHIDTRLGIVRIVPSGIPTQDDYRAVIDAVANHAHYRQGFNILSDRRGQAATPPTVKTLQDVVSMVASKVAAYWPGTRVAVLVDDDATYGMFRIAEVRFEEKGVELRVFRDEAAAVHWLTTGRDLDA